MTIKNNLKIRVNFSHKKCEQKENSQILYGKKRPNQDEFWKLGKVIVMVKFEK